MGMTDQEKIELLQEIVNEYRARTREVSRIAAQAPTDPDVDLRLLVDIVWQHATESTAVPFHKTSDMLIAKYRRCFPRAAQAPPVKD
jgi:hypothetical protein